MIREEYCYRLQNTQDWGEKNETTNLNLLEIYIKIFI